MAVKFEDFSAQCKDAIQSVITAWLHTWGNEIASRAKRGVAMDDNTGTQLRGSYRSIVDESQNKATIGSPLESAYWEEFGTGDFADTGKNGGISGRPGWWVYVKNSGNRGGTAKYSEDEAQAIAASMRASKGLDAYATQGRRPNYTLEKAFTSAKARAIADLENRLGRMD